MSRSGASSQRHRLIATIRGAMRRLAEPEEACFDDEEHAGAKVQPRMVAALRARSASLKFPWRSTIQVAVPRLLPGFVRLFVCV
jgi:hypothetical protein